MSTFELNCELTVPFCCVWWCSFVYRLVAKLAEVMPGCVNSQRSSFTPGRVRQNARLVGTPSNWNKSGVGMCNLFTCRREARAAQCASNHFIRAGQDA